MSYNKKNLEQSLLHKEVPRANARKDLAKSEERLPCTLENTSLHYQSRDTFDVIVSIVPTSSFQVVRNCATCNRKTRFQNSKRFRVNANGNKIDVWLIYSCEHCKHTLNLSIYERKSPNQIAPDEYQKFLLNDKALAKEYGRNKNFFSRNKAEIDWETLSHGYTTEFGQFPELSKINQTTLSNRIYVRNDYNLNLRIDKVAAEILQLSRSQLKKMTNDQRIILTKQHSDIIIELN